MTAAKGFPERLQKVLDAVGSNRRFAELVGIRHGTITAWMGGSAPFDSTFAKIEDATGVPASWLRDGEGDAAAALAQLTTGDSSRIREESTPYRSDAMVGKGMEHPDSPMSSIERTLLHAVHGLDCAGVAGTLQRVLSDKGIVPSERYRAARTLALNLVRRIDEERKKHPSKN